MTAEEFDEKWKNHLEKGHYGLAIGDERVVNYLDKKFEELYERGIDFTYSQIKLKFGSSRVYMEPNSIDTLEMEREINKILKS